MGVFNLNVNGRFYRLTLSAALKGRIDFKQGASVQQSYSDYDAIPIHDAPQIETLHGELG